MEMYEGKKCVVRCDRAGVFFGEVVSATNEMIRMRKVRKLWYWEGACAVEQIAVDGVECPEDCKFTVTVDEMVISSPIQIIPATEKAIESIEGVKEWKS